MRSTTTSTPPPIRPAPTPTATVISARPIPTTDRRPFGPAHAAGVIRFTSLASIWGCFPRCILPFPKHADRICVTSFGTEGPTMETAMSGSGRRRILVVEDAPEILGALSGLLEEEGYDVQSVADARDALERLRHGPTPEVIILDLMMPGMDGWEFRTIQRADPELAAIPVVAISADTSSKAAAIDATSFLRKPFRFADLLSTVEKIIDERERRRIRARLAEAERLASLGTLAAGAAHEISNPLSFTVANLETMDEQLSRLRQMTAELSARQLPEAHLLEDMKATLDDMSDLLADGRVGAERVSRVVRNLQSIARRQE